MKGEIDNSIKLEFSMRNKEKIWCIPSKDRISIFFSIHFENNIDKTICKLILNELEESKRHVQNSPSIQKMLDGAIPDLLKKEFPNSEAIHEKTNNGIICFSILLSFASHILIVISTLREPFQASGEDCYSDVGF